MPSKILPKKASPATSGREPLPSDLDAGELAINSTDGRLFSKREDGTIIEIGASIPVGSMIWFAGDTAPLGWLVMNGDPVSAAFPDLRAHLVAEGYPFGTDGTDPLLPDLITDGLFEDIAMLPCIKAYSAALNTGMADLSELLTAIATQGEAEAGTDNTKLMTPLRSAQAIAALAPVPGAQCVAWVNFNGTGTVAINGSYNVSSITDNGTGTYTVNFTTALESADYAVIVTVQGGDGNYFGSAALAGSYGAATGSVKTTAAVKITTMVQGPTSVTIADNYNISVAIFI